MSCQPEHERLVGTGCVVAVVHQHEQEELPLLKKLASRQDQ